MEGLTDPLVSVITLNYNSFEATIEFLKSVRATKYTNVEVILVDNNSRDFEEELLIDIIPNLIVIKSDSNLGFAGGHNLGVSKASGDIYAFLNNDLVIEEDFFQPILEVFQNYDRVGIVTPKFIYDGTNIIQYAGADKLSHWFGIGNKLGDREDDHGQYDFVKEVGIVHGGAMLIARKVYEIVGPIPEAYFLYYEEIEWGQVISTYGYKLYYCGLSKVYDKVSQSIGAENPLKIYYLSRNRILYARRNTKGIVRVCWLSYMLLLSYPYQLIKYILEGRPKAARAIIFGVISNLLNVANPDRYL